MEKIAFIGFGEAGRAFTHGRPEWVGRARAFDIKTDHPDTAAAERAAYAAAGIRGCDTVAEALADAGLVFSLVTADQALAAARDDAPSLAPGALWLDCNSVAPDTKRAAAEAIERAGGRYADVAVMAPVFPAARDVPLLVSGPHASAAAVALAALGFGKVRVIEGLVGAASAIKMIRSVMVKGLEALTTECVLAAEAAGVRDEVLASLNASWPGTDWGAKADYNLDRMLVHGERRAAEMEEVVKTLEALGTGAEMTRGTVLRQRAAGVLGMAPPEGLDAKLAALLGHRPR